MLFSCIEDVATWNHSTQLLTQGQKVPAPEFLRPYHFVLLALQLQRYGKNVRLPEHLQEYAARMHLWDAIGRPAPVQVNERDATGRFQPLVALRNENDVWQIAGQLTELLRTSCLDDATVSSVHGLSCELLGNCYAHSESTNGTFGLVCAQSWPRGNKAQIAIGDSGIGIRASLAASGLYDALLESGNSCEIATGYQVTSKPGRGHAGYGLTLALGLIERNYGALHILSGHEYFFLRANERQRGTLGTPVDGTLIVIEWNTAIGLDARAVYNSWPLPEGYANDDFDI